MATSDFQVRGDNWTATDPLAQRSWWGFPGIWGDVPFDLTPLYSMQTAASNMTRLEPSECISRFVNPWTATQNLVLVAQNVSSAHNNGSSLIDGWMSGWDIWTNSHAWICSQYPQKASRACTEEWASTFADNWIVAGAPISEGSPVRENVAVDYCLVGESVDIDNRCGLHFSVYLTGIVCFFTAAEALLIWLTWLNHTKTKSDPTGRRQETMVTMGDAISDFLERPDELAAARDSEFPRASYTVRVGRWREECVSWFKGVSTRTWVISITV